MKLNTWSGSPSVERWSLFPSSHLKPVHQGISKWKSASTASGRSIYPISKSSQKKASKLPDNPFQSLSNPSEKEISLMSNLKHLFCDLSHCFSFNLQWKIGTGGCCCPNQEQLFPEYLKLYTSCKLNTCAYIHSHTSGGEHAHIHTHTHVHTHTHTHTHDSKLALSQKQH